MAIQIKSVPEIKGKDARKFEKEIENINPISQEEKNYAILLMNKVLENSVL